MDNNYDQYRTELALILIDAGATHLEFDAQNWKVQFKVRNTEFYCYFDDGIDCMFNDGNRFYSPLEWDKKHLQELQFNLQQYAAGKMMYMDLDKSDDFESLY